MKDYDDLERQLQDRVRDLASAPVGASRWRRRRLIAVVAVPLALAGGAAAATAIVGREPGVQERAERLANRAVSISAKTDACTYATGRVPSDGRLRLVETSAPDEILRRLPVLSPEAPGQLSDAAIRTAIPPDFPVGRVVRSSVRVASFPDGSQVVVLVSFGSDFAPKDPAACTANRKTRLLDERRAAGKATDDAVTIRALYLLDHRRDTDPRSPSLWVIDRPDGRNTAGGVGSPLEPGTTLRTGLLYTGSGSGNHHRKRFIGIAAPGATSITVRAAPGSPRSRSTRAARVVARHLSVQAGIFALSEPSQGAGHLVIEHRARDGKVLLRSRLQ